MFISSFKSLYLYIFLYWPNQLPSRSDLKTAWWEMWGSIPSHACWPSSSELSVIFSEIRVITGQDPLQRLSRWPRFYIRIISLIIQPNSSSLFFKLIFWQIKACLLAFCLHKFRCSNISFICMFMNSRSKKMKHPYLFQY